MSARTIRSEGAAAWIALRSSPGPGGGSDRLLADSPPRSPSWDRLAAPRARSGRRRSAAGPCSSLASPTASRIAVAAASTATRCTISTDSGVALAGVGAAAAATNAAPIPPVSPLPDWTGSAAADGAASTAGAVSTAVRNSPARAVSVSRRNAVTASVNFRAYSDHQEAKSPSGKRGAIAGHRVQSDITASRNHGGSYRWRRSIPTPKR